MKPIIGLLAASLVAYSLDTSSVWADDPTVALHGEWKVTALYVDGQADSGVSFQGMRFVFDKEHWTTFSGWTTPAGLAKKPPLQAVYSLDNNEEPKHFDFTFLTSDTRLERHAIYKIEDDQLYLCLSKSDRPATFDTTGTRNLCYVAKRTDNEPDKVER